MKKKHIKELLIIMGIIFGIALQIIVNTYDKDEDILCDVFANSNVIGEQGELILQGKLSDKYMTDQDIKEMLRYISKLAGVREEKCSVNTEGKWNFEGEKEDVKLVIGTEKFNDVEPTLIRIKVECGYKELLYIRKELNEFFQEMNVEKLENNLILKGCYMGKLTNQYIENNTNKMYRELEGKEIIKQYENGVFYSYGYTDKIDEYIEIENKKVNINIVYTYDETENQTWIYLGSPIINIDY